MGRAKSLSQQVSEGECGRQLYPRRHSKALLESQHAETKTAGAELVPSEFQASLRNRTTVSKKKKKSVLVAVTVTTYGRSDGHPFCGLEETDGLPHKLGQTKASELWALVPPAA